MKLGEEIQKWENWREENVWIWSKYIILTEKHWQIAEHEGTHLILAPQRQKQVDLYEFETSLVYTSEQDIQTNIQTNKQTNIKQLS